MYRHDQPGISILKVKLSNIEDDVEIVAGSSITMMVMERAVTNNPSMSYEKITAEEARKHLEADDYAGAGIYVADTSNVVEDNRRMSKSYQLQVYLNTRIGGGSINHPIVLD